MLRASSQTHGETVSLEAIMDPDVDSGVPSGELLVRFAQAASTWDCGELEALRGDMVGGLGEGGLVDAAGVASNFERMVRIADATGIELDASTDADTADLRRGLDIDALRRADTSG